MTEREKIIKIIAPIVSAHGKDEAIADALIKAGIGDVRWWERKCKLCEEDWFLQKKQIEHYAESYKEMLQEDLDKYKHRAEVAEWQAILLSKWLAEKTRKDYPWRAWFDAAQKQAERELAEEGKDE